MGKAGHRCPIYAFSNISHHSGKRTLSVFPECAAAWDCTFYQRRMTYLTTNTSHFDDRGAPPITDQAIYGSPSPTAVDRPFNGFRIAKSQRATDVVLDVRHQVQAYEMHRIRQRAKRHEDQRAFERQVEALVCDLACREISKPGSWLAIPFSKHVLGRKSRYRSAALSQTLPDVAQHMASPEMEFVEIIKGHRNPFEPALSRQTTIRAGKRLRDRIEDYQLELEDFGLGKAEEVIILKDAKEDHWDKGKWLQYEDTPQTIAYRDELQRINEWLEQANIEYIYTDTHEQVVDTSDRRLRRYFNNSSFEQGGRLFGGFWQPLRKHQRHGIVIDGMDTITLDYGQMVPRVLYGLAGIDLKLDDAYVVPGLEGYRDGVKKVFNAMLHADKPLERKPQGSAGLLPAKLSIAEVTDKIIGLHEPVSHVFHTGVGLYLTYQESRILLTVLARLMEQGITALPIHDAVIVAEEHQDRTTGTMLQVFKDITGIDGLVSVEA